MVACVDAWVDSFVRAVVVAWSSTLAMEVLFGSWWGMQQEKSFDMQLTFLVRLAQNVFD